MDDYDIKPNGRVNRGLHWTTKVSEKFLLAIIGGLTMIAAAEQIWLMYNKWTVQLGDLFLLFIYAEVVGMVGAFYASHRIPVTIPIIIAITALCRLVVLHSKDMAALQLLAETGAIAVLAVSAYLMSLKDKLSLEKERLRDE